ncbi:MAG: hypothetical protein ACE5I1_06150, partial [bacterium]
MHNIKIFLASSSELKTDREQFEIFHYRQNKLWVKQGIFLEIIIWEDFFDALSPTRLQDEYNKEIKHCDLFVMLFHTKVGKYTAEEFETAFGRFQATQKPFIFTYRKDAVSGKNAPSPEDAASLKSFLQKLDQLGHFPTIYKNIEGLQLHFSRQLDRLAAKGFMEMPALSKAGAAPSPGATG